MVFLKGFSDNGGVVEINLDLKFLTVGLSKIFVITFWKLSIWRCQYYSLSKIVKLYIIWLRNNDFFSPYPVSHPPYGYGILSSLWYDKVCFVVNMDQLNLIFSHFRPTLNSPVIPTSKASVVYDGCSVLRCKLNHASLHPL